MIGGIDVLVERHFGEIILILVSFLWFLLSLASWRFYRRFNHGRFLIISGFSAGVVSCTGCILTAGQLAALVFN